MKRMSSLALATALFATAPAALLPVAAATDAAAGQALAKRFADAIIGIELVVTIKVKMGDREQPPQERRLEVDGTVISAGGLTVTSLASVDPQVQFDAMRAAQGGCCSLSGISARSTAPPAGRGGARPSLSPSSG